MVIDWRLEAHYTKTKTFLTQQNSNYKRKIKAHRASGDTATNFKWVIIFTVEINCYCNLKKRKKRKKKLASIVSTGFYCFYYVSMHKEKQFVTVGRVLLL